MRTHRRPAAVAAASFLLLAGAVAAAPAAHAGIPGATHAADRNTDFNGDGYEDVLTGAPGGTVGGDARAGYVTVQYGSSSGIGTGRRTVVHQDTAGVPGATEAGDAFGKALASGDLDGDGYDDAIVGAPGEDIGTVADAGGAVVLWGTPQGLRGDVSQWLEADEPTAGKTFGTSLAAARFTGETTADLLAVLDGDGLRLYLFEPVAQPAARTAEGTAAGPERTVREAAAPARGTGRSAPGAESEGGVRPTTLTTGDYDDNGYADLVLSGLTTGPEPGHGWSAFFSGQEESLVYERDLRGGPVTASGDLDGDGYDDLVTAEPHSPDDGGEGTTGGLVGVYTGSPDGPLGTDGADSPPQWWTQDSSGVPGVAEQGDGWGADLSIGDTDGDGYADLAIGADGEDIGAVADAGAVWLLRGSALGPTTARVRDFSQNTADVPGAAEAKDRFGGQVRLVDPNRDGRFGLLAAAPGENTGDGGVWVFSATANGLTAAGSWAYDGGSLGAPDADAAYGAAIDE